MWFAVFMWSSLQLIKHTETLMKISAVLNPRGFNMDSNQRGWKNTIHSLFTKSESLFHHFVSPSKKKILSVVFDKDSLFLPQLGIDR